MKDVKEPYIIVETAFHHEGDEDFLIKLIQESEKREINAIKFHVTIDLDEYMIKEHEAIEILRPWCFGESQWKRILSHVKSADIVLLCNEVKSLEFAKTQNVAAVEIHATGLNDLFLLDAASNFQGTVILGSGGSSLDEIDYAVRYLRSKGQEDILLMHGFQNYPTDYQDVKLHRMQKLHDLFDLPVGYADHTDPNNPFNEYISCLGIATGHPILEKHVTTHFGEKRIDAQAAISFDQLDKIIKLAKIANITLGRDSALVLSSSELKYGDVGPMKKAIVASKSITKGEKVTLEHIMFKRTNNSSSLKQNELHKVLNGSAIKSIAKDEIIDLSNVDFEFKTQDFKQFKKPKQ